MSVYSKLFCFELGTNEQRKSNAAEVLLTGWLAPC